MRGRVWSALLAQVLLGAAGLIWLGPSGLLVGAPVSGLLVPVTRRTWWGVATGALVLAALAIVWSWRISRHLSDALGGIGGGALAVLLVVAASLLLARAAAVIRPALLLRAPRRQRLAVPAEDWPEWDRPVAHFEEVAAVSPPQTDAAAPARPDPAAPDGPGPEGGAD